MESVFKKIYRGMQEEGQERSVSHMHQRQNDIIVFSHLRWEFVFQRPQHIMTRFAQDRKIVFIEEPLPQDGAGDSTELVYSPQENVTVIQPKFSPERLELELPPLVAHYSKKLNLHNPLLWFYSAHFYEVLAHLTQFSLVVYDCMDELSAFRGASPDLKSKEIMLLKRADVVFTGGKSLYESKKTLRDEVYCFPSSVDQAHFKKSLLSFTRTPRDIARISKPIAGFYGVLDERMDTGLLGQLADRMPDVSFVMIGPIVKISPDDLPQRRNIHYLGPKEYKQLPAYLKNFNVAIMPFAMNESTRFISPTKTLEFMAALKPIVSAPIRDVVTEYSREVDIAANAEEFELAIRKALVETPKDRFYRQLRQQAVLKRTSWDQTVSSMQRILLDATITKQQEESGLVAGYPLPAV